MREKGTDFSCKAKGIFCIGKETCFHNDFEIYRYRDLEGNVVKDHKKKNALIRPAVNMIR